MTEIQLIFKCRKGDGEAFRILLNNYRKQLFSYLFRYCNNKDVAEEIFQETLIKVWKGIKNYNDQKKFSSWLFTIAHNVAIDHVRKRKRNEGILSLDEIDTVFSNSNVNEELDNKETIRIINSSLNNLSEKQKVVFLLRTHGELTFKEISETTKEPLNTVLSHMHYSIKKIKKNIEYQNEPRKRTVI